MSFLGGLKDLAGSVIGTLATPFVGSTALSMAGGLYENKKARDEAKRQRDWEYEMSSTAHQREVKDLQAAGLNPMLSVNHGASTPTAAVAQVKDPITPGLNTGISAKLMQAQAVNLLSQADLNSANAGKIRVETPVNDYEGMPYGYWIAQKARFEAWLQAAHVDLTHQQQDKVIAEVENLWKQGNLLDIENKLKQLGIPEAEAMANFWKSEIGKLSPYLDPLKGAAGTVSSALGGGAAAKYLFKKAPLNLQGGKSIGGAAQKGQPRDKRGRFVKRKK